MAHGPWPTGGIHRASIVCIFLPRASRRPEGGQDLSRSGRARERGGGGRRARDVSHYGRRRRPLVGARHISAGPRGARRRRRKTLSRAVRRHVAHMQARTGVAASVFVRGGATSGPVSTAAPRMRRHRLPMIVPTGSGATYSKATQASVGSTAALIAYVRFAAIRRGGGAARTLGHRREEPGQSMLCIAYGLHKLRAACLLVCYMPLAEFANCRPNCRGRGGGLVVLSHLY